MLSKPVLLVQLSCTQVLLVMQTSDLTSKAPLQSTVSWLLCLETCHGVYLAVTSRVPKEGDYLNDNFLYQEQTHSHKGPHPRGAY